MFAARPFTCCFGCVQRFGRHCASTRLGEPSARENDCDHEAERKAVHSSIAGRLRREVHSISDNQEEHAFKMMQVELTDTYETNWGAVLSSIHRHIDAGERSLSRVLRLTEAEWRTMDLRPTKGTSLGEKVVMPRAALFGARQTMRMRALAKACRPNTTMIVELGSGWGNNLLDFYLSGGPRDARYYALEPTRAGRECVSTLASLEPDLRLAALAFDYRAPDYSALPTDNPHVVVFTSHSIETVPQLSESVITKLLERGTSVTGVHFEPIGWQIPNNTNNVGATQDYSRNNRYNENLWALLSDLVARSLITIETVTPDIFHHKTYNASTLVIWHTA